MKLKILTNYGLNSKLNTLLGITIFFRTKLVKVRKTFKIPRNVNDCLKMKIMHKIFCYCFSVLGKNILIIPTGLLYLFYNGRKWQHFSNYIRGTRCFTLSCCFSF